MPTTTATDIIIATTKDLTAALKNINKNPLLPPYDTITHKALLKWVTSSQMPLMQ